MKSSMLYISAQNLFYFLSSNGLKVDNLGEVKVNRDPGVYSTLNGFFNKPEIIFQDYFAYNSLPEVYYKIYLVWEDTKDPLISYYNILFIKIIGNALITKDCNIHKRIYFEKVTV